jgi:hypothetical protein
MKDTIWLVDMLFILNNPGIIVISLPLLLSFNWQKIPLLLKRSVIWLAVKRVRRNKSNCFQIIHDHKDYRSVTHNWPTFDKWRIWEHDHYFHACQEKQVFCVMFLLFIYNVSTLIHRTLIISTIRWGRRGRNRMVVGFLSTYAFTAYHH